jgi:hypothetical protein
MEKDIPEIIIEPEGLLEKNLHGTFVLIQGQDEKYHIYMGVLGIKHSDLYKDFLLVTNLQNKIEQYKPIGGGLINYFTEELFGKNEIEVEGFSRMYGKFNSEITKKLLENKFKGFKVVIR